MERLDQTYLNDLVTKAKQGNSNAFAELYTSVGGRQYAYLLYMLKDPALAASGLEEVFVQALKGMRKLPHAGMFMSWVSHLSYRYCRDLLSESKSEKTGPEAEMSENKAEKTGPAAEMSESRADKAGPEGEMSESKSEKTGPEAEVSESRIDSPEAAVLMNLPLAESQASLMYFVQEMPVDEIGDILNLSSATIRRRIRSGRKHLTQWDRVAGKEAAVSKRSAAGKEAAVSKRSAAEKNAAPQRNTMDAPGGRIRKKGHHILAEADALQDTVSARILERVFERCGKESNSAPLVALSSYVVYRRERFSLQRGILAAAMILFLLLPALFILPKFQVSSEPEGERGLPVYKVEVASVLPVGRVTASLRRHRLPVYEAGSRTFTVEPTRNGKLSIDVELINRQSAEAVLDVTDVDSVCPKLISSETGENSFSLEVEDEGIGIDYHEIYAVGESGTIYEPLTADAENGIVFEYPAEPWDVYIPDYIGNMLHLSIHFG